MVVRIFFRKISKETRLKRDIPGVVGTMISGNRIMISMNRIPSDTDIQNILRILNSEEWELISPSKSKFDTKRITREERIRRREIKDRKARIGIQVMSKEYLIKSGENVNDKGDKE